MAPFSVIHTRLILLISRLLFPSPKPGFFILYKPSADHLLLYVPFIFRYSLFTFVKFVKFLSYASYITPVELRLFFAVSLFFFDRNLSFQFWLLFLSNRDVFFLGRYNSSLPPRGYHDTKSYEVSVKIILISQHLAIKRDDVTTTTRSEHLQEPKDFCAQKRWTGCGDHWMLMSPDWLETWFIYLLVLSEFLSWDWNTIKRFINV